MSSVEVSPSYWKNAKNGEKRIVEEEEEWNCKDLCVFDLSEKLSTMDSSSNLHPLHEHIVAEEDPVAPASVFAARPLRPPSTWVSVSFLNSPSDRIFTVKLVCCFCRSSSEKYSPVEWTSYFDKEDDISITGSDDVRFNELILSFPERF